MPKTYVREKYRHIKDFEKRVKIAALDVSDNGRCWWIYKYVCSLYRVNVRTNKRKKETINVREPEEMCV